MIVHEGRLLAITMKDGQGLFYILPGGGQRHGESLADTVRRECLEEIGVEVEVGDLLYVREYIGCHHGFAREHKDFHQLEVVFRCRLPNPSDVLRPGKGQDNRQVGVAWLELKDLESLRFYPAVVKAYIRNGDIHVSPLYLGDCN